MSLIGASMGIQFVYYLIYPFSILPYLLDWILVLQLLIIIKDSF